ncbi:MAG: radical SAM protein [Deltaproteobacteria bacterium]|nr:radical SAM protein [Deltaproteobacteria bacterium]
MLGRTVKKVRFIEPGNLPYRPSLRNLYTYDKTIRTPSTGLLTLTTIVKGTIADTLMYSESISRIRWKDVYCADIVFIGIFTFAANRGYQLAKRIRRYSNAIVVMGGLHASMNYSEAVHHCDYVLLNEGDESILEFIAAVNGTRSLDFPGLAYQQNDQVIFTGYRPPPADINTIPKRDLLYNYRKMAGHNTLWPQVHASRGCPHDCNYCAVVRHFGRKVRKRTPENVVADIRACIDFHDNRLIPRLSRVLWITDDNFFADRKWAMSVLEAIIESGIRYRFTVQARYEVGFDDKMLSLLKQAGFFELAMGIEFIDDHSFEEYNKSCTRADVVKSIRNIQKHGLSVRGLFIAGADSDRKGIGDAIADFVISHDINGILIQSMYFIPGTPVYKQYRNRLIHQDWSKYNGSVVHYPGQMSPFELQKEIIHAIRKVYSWKRLWMAIRQKTSIERLLFVGEFFWQRSVCKTLTKQLPFLNSVSAANSSIRSENGVG